MKLVKVLSILFLFGILLMYSCVSSNKSKNLTVSVSIPPEVYIVNSIAGDKVDVKCLMTKGNNPESFEPTVNQIINLSNSDIYFTIGLLDFEYGLKDRIQENDKNMEIVNFADSIDLLYGTHGDCDHKHHIHNHNEADPHIWSSIKNLKRMGIIVCEILSRKDAANKSFYCDNLEKYLSKLDSVDITIKNEINKASSKSFIVWHPSLSYFANEYGLTQISVGSHNKEQSISQLRDRINDALDNDAHIFFYQKEFDSSQAVSANEKINARFVEINSMNEDPVSELLLIANELSK